jgi:hypothetical protein
VKNCRRLIRFVVVAAVLCAGCAGVAVDEQADALLGQGDRRMASENYSGAMDSYAKFADENPDHPLAARARATQKALVRLLASEAELGRAQRGGEATRRELTERQSETERLKVEVTKLRTDLERLRNIDLQPSRPR